MRYNQVNNRNKEQAAMNPVYKLYCRSYQRILKCAMHFISIPMPETGNSISHVADMIHKNHLIHPLIVSGPHVSKSESVRTFLDELEKSGIVFSLFSKISKDPNFSDIDSLYDFYNENTCDSLIAIGGGSVIDATKALGCKIVQPKKAYSKLRGLLKVKKDLPFFIAIPTTAGTGSEATVASVITNETNGDKFAINDPHLVPKIAVLDSSLLKSLPKKMIAESGMDAFCHALEAYIGNSNSKLTKKYAMDAILLIHDNLFSFYNDSNNEKIRENMLKASYYAGISFTRAYVGYVHALAHAVGGMYHLPHGYCIAVLLPYVLKHYKSSIFKSLAQINDQLKLSHPQAIEEEKSIVVIQWIEDLRNRLGIPADFGGIIKEEDFSKLAKHASKEANPLYPVPRILSARQLEEILREANIGIKPNHETA